MQPLAERLRPTILDNYVGQSHLVGKGAILRNAMDQQVIPSMILWGPPGVGKTTLAEIIAKKLDRPFYKLSAIASGVKDVRAVIAKSEDKHLFSGPKPILFIDEIHRFSKSQQDALLGAVEKGIFTLIGATTENPSFEVISALLSRCQVYVLKHLEKEELEQLLHAAIKEDKYLQNREIDIQETDGLIAYSSGDARRLLNCLEIVVNQIPTDQAVVITDEIVHNIIKHNPILYDKTGESHYNVISAFIKSIRGSDPNAAVYYLALMVEAGEDPLFICRRMIIAASEDIGLANPNALLMANQCFQSVHQIGYPEARIIMSQAAIYLACSDKSNASYLAIKQAQSLVRERQNLPIPLHLRNAPTKLMKDIGYGSDYKYSHDYKDNFATQEYLPKEISKTVFYKPQKNRVENQFKSKLDAYWKGHYDFEE